MTSGIINLKIFSNSNGFAEKHAFSTADRPEQPTVVEQEYPYRDDGCQVSPSCLACPLEQCKHDDTKGLMRARVANRRKLICDAMEANGWSAQVASKELRVSVRTIYRAIAALE